MIIPVLQAKEEDCPFIGQGALELGGSPAREDKIGIMEELPVGAVQPQWVNVVDVPYARPRRVTGMFASSPPFFGAC
jgi:hypothetical protein